MCSVNFGQLVKISYTGSYDIPTGGTKHFAKVETSNDVEDYSSEDGVAPKDGVEKDPCDIKYSIQNLSLL